MDLGVFDAWAGLLISHPHHQLSAAPSVSQITEFVVVVWPEDKKRGGQLHQVVFSAYKQHVAPHFSFNQSVPRCVWGVSDLLNQFICQYVCYDLHLFVLLCTSRRVSLYVCDLSGLLCCANP